MVQVVRVKTSITMDRAVLEWVRRRIEDGIFASKSHAIEYALRHLIREEKKENRLPYPMDNG